MARWPQWQGDRSLLFSPPSLNSEVLVSEPHSEAPRATLELCAHPASCLLVSGVLEIRRLPTSAMAFSRPAIFAVEEALMFFLPSL